MFHVKQLPKAVIQNVSRETIAEAEGQNVSRETICAAVKKSIIYVKITQIKQKRGERGNSWARR